MKEEAEVRETKQRKRAALWRWLGIKERRTACARIYILSLALRTDMSTRMIRDDSTAHATVLCSLPCILRTMQRPDQRSDCPAGSEKYCNYNATRRTTETPSMLDVERIYLSLMGRLYDCSRCCLGTRREHDPSPRIHFSLSCIAPLTPPSMHSSLCEKQLAKSNFAPRYQNAVTARPAQGVVARHA